MAGDYGPWFDPAHPMNVRVHRRPTIDELERLLDSEEDVAITILPNGEIRALEDHERIIKPLTMRENLGGEYSVFALGDSFIAHRLETNYLSAGFSRPLPAD